MMKKFKSDEEEIAYYSVRRSNLSRRRKWDGLSQTARTGYALLKRLLIIAAIGYGVQHRSDIKHSLRRALAENKSVKEMVDSVAFLKREMTPLTESEKARRQAYHEEQRRRAADLRAEGIEPYIKYVGPNDPEWEEAKAGMRELKKCYGNDFFK